MARELTLGEAGRPGLRQPEPSLSEFTAHSHSACACCAWRHPDVPLAIFLAEIVSAAAKGAESEKRAFWEPAAARPAGSASECAAADDAAVSATRSEPAAQAAGAAVSAAATPSASHEVFPRERHAPHYTGAAERAVTS